MEKHTTGSFEDIRKDNKKLMMELSGVKRTTAEGIPRCQEIAEALRKNNQDLHAMAAAFGPDSALPRIMQHKLQNQRGYGTK